MRCDASHLAAAIALSVVAAGSACDLADDRTPRPAGPGVDKPDLPLDPDGDGPASDCDVTGAVPTLEAIEQRFVADIYPLMTRAESGCIACHDDVSGRAMVVSAPENDGGVSTFLRLRGTGFFTFHPGTAVARVLDETMPLGGPAWSAGEKAVLERFGCDLRRVDGDDPIPLDEQFPAQLDRPYTGAPVDDYDNAFVNYSQLRGRVDVVFDDAWVREGVDKFSENIALFGGVDFISSFVPARQATAEFLAGLDLLAEDVCDRAAADGTGPFEGLDLLAPLIDEPASSVSTFQAEAPTNTIANLPEGCRPGPRDTRVVLCTNASVTAEFNAPSAGNYRVTAAVTPQPNTTGERQPIMEFRVDGLAKATRTVPGTVATTVSATITIDRGGVLDYGVAFINDSGEGGDRNLLVDFFTIEGPIPGTTDGAVNGARDTRDQLALLATRILQRPFIASANADVDETAALYDVLLAMDAFLPGQRRQAWAGACEAMVQHPDFLFTRPPTFDTATDAALRERFLTVQAAFVLLDRPPNNDELGRLDVGEVDRADLIDGWLASPEHSSSYLNRVREILEFDGTPDGEEPARLWNYIERNDRPLKEILTGTYTVDVDGNRVDRPAFHGQTGLTMKGYIVGKPGLPAYNYAARVMTGFMGRVFDVPQAALDARATATAISTVDPTSLCFSCHNVLTPLAHQRLKWDNDGNHRETFADGRDIDDSDNDLVAGYPFKGTGLEAFSLVAVKKEAFARRMANAHFLMVFGRLLRLEGTTANEGAVYRQIFDAIDAGNGTFKDIERLILLSTSVTTPPASAAIEPLTGLVGGAP